MNDRDARLPEDTEGHLVRKDDGDEGDDAEGHRLVSKVEGGQDDPTEGHPNRKALGDEDDDTEGHYVRR